MFRITSADIDPTGIGTWAVRAPMFGETVTVFTGTIFECTAFIRENGV